MNYTSIGQNAELTANKPFVFAICNQKTNTIMFIGKVAYPEQ
jgi:serine protease inhibitor